MYALRMEHGFPVNAKVISSAGLLIGSSFLVKLLRAEIIDVIFAGGTTNGNLPRLVPSMVSTEGFAFPESRSFDPSFTHEAGSTEEPVFHFGSGSPFRPLLH